MVVTDRAVSTVLDVSACLLLVSAAVLTLLQAPVAGPDPAADRAAEVATTLSGATATVSYPSGGGRRRAHGTLAGLLADAAVSNATPDTGVPFRAAVENATRPLLGDTGWRGQVVVTWQPYAGAEAATVSVGDDPPPGVDVHVATTTVPSGVAPAREEAARAAERRGFDGVAAVVAARTPGESSEDDVAADLADRHDSPDGAATSLRLGQVRLTVRTWST